MRVHCTVVPTGTIVTFELAFAGSWNAQHGTFTLWTWAKTGNARTAVNRTAAMVLGRHFISGTPEPALMGNGALSWRTGPGGIKQRGAGGAGRNETARRQAG